MFEPIRMLDYIQQLDDLSEEWQRNEGSNNGVYHKIVDAVNLSIELLKGRCVQILGRSRCGGCEHYEEHEVYSEWSCGGFGKDPMTGKFTAVFYCRSCGNRHPRTLDNTGKFTNG